MLLRDKFETVHFSESEQIIVDYILENKTSIKAMTIRDISEVTYTSPSTLIRIAKKMSYKGWNELKDDFLKEEEYISKHFRDIDANYPFQRNDSIMDVANAIRTLRNVAVDDTLSLLTHDDLQGAIRIIRKSSYIGVYAASNNLNLIHEFKHNMSRIRKRVDIYEQQGETVFSANLQEKDSCAIIISYSGETMNLIRIARTLKARGIPTICMTSIGENSISQLSDVTLRICSRERIFSKIGTFTTDSAISYLLDVLYSCIFQLDYDNNKVLKSRMNKIVEKERYSTNKILSEQSDEHEFYIDE